MGASATPWHVRICVSALAAALADQGVDVDAKAALAAAAAKLVD
jgi:alanine-glyoxylate transaminase/serine-glyoxylate transaminase/serine-pyruvate transaminase